jgi:hypothetical protein
MSYCDDDACNEPAHDCAYRDELESRAKILCKTTLYQMEKNNILTAAMQSVEHRLRIIAAHNAERANEHPSLRGSAKPQNQNEWELADELKAALESFPRFCAGKKGGN